MILFILLMFPLLIFPIFSQFFFFPLLQRPSVDRSNSILSCVPCRNPIRFGEEGREGGKGSKITRRTQSVAAAAVV